LLPPAKVVEPERGRARYLAATEDLARSVRGGGDIFGAPHDW